MSYVALYRKFRPQTFDQIKGQEHVVQALRNQILQGRIGHAYLFTGTRGTGKTSAAKIFAKAVNCLHPTEQGPCNECENCRSINAGNFVDVTEVDAASNNGVDDIRRIIEEVRYTPVKGKYKVFIIDEAHMITGPAFNAFLKTLEEPPAYAVFILATTEPHKLPVTILSRCQRYDFRRIPSEKITDNLARIAAEEGISAEPKALAYIARMGDGSMRDSISLLDKCIAFRLGDALTYENVLDTLGTVDTEVFSRMFGSISKGDVTAALRIVDAAVAQGRDLTQFTTDLIWYIRNLLMVRTAGADDLELLGVSPDNMQQLSRDATIADPEILIRYIRILSELLNQIRFSSAKQVLLEIGVIRLAKPETQTDTASLADRIRQLEELVRSGAAAVAPVMPQQAPYISRDTIPEPYPEYPEEGPAQMWGPELYGGSEPDPYSSPEPGLYTAPEPEIPEPAVQETDVFDGAQAPESGFTQIWERMVASCTNTRIRITLKKCTAETAGDHTVKIFAPNIVLLKQLQEPDTVSGLRELARQAAGKDMEIQLSTGEAGAGRTEGKNAFPEDLLQNINFNIGTEEW